MEVHALAQRYVVEFPNVFVHQADDWLRDEPADVARMEDFMSRWALCVGFWTGVQFKHSALWGYARRRVLLEEYALYCVAYQKCKAMIGNVVL